MAVPLVPIAEAAGVDALAGGRLAMRMEGRPLATRLDQLQAVMRRVMEERLVIPFTSEHSLLFLSRELDWRPRADTFRLAAEIRPAAR